MNPPGTTEVEAVLNGILDPCSEAAGNPTGLIDMGLVTGLVVEPATAEAVAIRAVINVTEPGCFMGAVFLAEARKRLEALPGVERVELELGANFDWHPVQMSGLAAERMHSLRRALEVRIPLTSLGFLDRRPAD